jgi:DUF4097 and DUF4098 domain-containing protein YvlB
MKTLLILGLLLPATVLAAGQRIDERRSVEPEARIEVGNVAGRIAVEAWDRDEVEIRGELGEGAKGLLIEGDAGRLSIKVDYPRGGNGGGWFGWWGGGRVGDTTLDLKVPARALLTLSAVSADIDVQGMVGRELVAKSVSGGVRIDADPQRLEVGSVSGKQRLRSAAGEISAETVSGSVEVRAEAPQSLRAESVSGTLDLQVSGSAASVTAESVSGSIRLSGALAPGARIRMESLSGGIDLRLPRATSARLSASSFSGRIDSDAGEVERKRYGPGSSLAHTLGKGDADVSLESFSGGIRIRLE